MKIKAFGRELSLLEGPTEKALTRAKAYDTKGIPDLMQDPARTWARLHGFRNIYLQGGYVAEGVDLFPIYAFGDGYEIEIDEKIAEKLGIDGEAEKQEVKELFDKINFFDVQWQLSVDAEVVRDGVAEIVYGNGARETVPVNVIVRPAESFDFVTNTTGTITSYDQVRDNRGNTIPKVPLEPARVLHYQFLSRPDSPYGISLVERTVHDIKRDTKVAEAITSGICLHGTPKFVTTVNGDRPDAAPLSDVEWKEMEDSQKNFNAKDNFLYEGNVKMTVVDTTGVQNVQMYSDVTILRVAAGMGFPGELIGLRQGTTDATAVSRIGAFLKKIKIVQRDIESLWNLGVIDKVTGKPGLIKLKLNDANPEDFLQIAQALAALRSGQNPEKVAPWQWCRQRLKIPTNKELGIPEVPEDEPAPQVPQGMFPFGGQPGSDQQDKDQQPGRSEQDIAATKEMAAAAHELAEAVCEERELAAEEGTWITINGVHILIKDGETTADAFKRTTGKDIGGHTSHPSLSSGSDQLKGQIVEGHVYDGETYAFSKNDYKKISSASPEQLKERASAIADLDKERLGKKFGLAKRERMRQSLMPTAEYRAGLGQGKLDKYNAKPYSEYRPHPAYNMGYYEGYDISVSATELNDVPYNPNFHAAKKRKAA